MKLMNNGRKSSLQVKSLLLILVLFFLPFIMLSILLYARQSNSYREQEILSEYSLTSQIGQNIDNLFYDVKQKSLLLYKEQFFLEYLLKDGEGKGHELLVSNHLSEIQAYDRYISGITVMKSDGEYCSNSSYFDKLSERISPSELDESGRLHLIKELQADDKSEYIVLGRTIKNPISLSDAIGYLYVYVKKDVFNTIVGSISSLDSQSFFLYDKRSEYFYDISRNNHYSSILDFASFEEGARYVEKDGTDYIYAAFALNIDDNLLLLHIAKAKPIGVELKWLLLSLICSALVMSVIFTLWSNNNIFKRINRISKAMDSLERDDFKTNIKAEGNDEITLLTNSFNQMNERLNELVNEVYASKIREKESTIKSLMAYINPHFFFNTLDTICWMSRQEDALETCELIEALSKLFRLKLDNSKPVISVKEEIANVKEYLKIQECRFADRISFSFSYGSDVENLLTVSSVIQPLIENAIYHGIEAYDIEAAINVSIRIEEDVLLIEVSNTGVMPDLKILNDILHEYKEGKKGLAIYSINRRIQLLYGDSFGLSFKAQNSRLIATIKQPIRRFSDGIEAIDC